MYLTGTHKFEGMRAGDVPAEDLSWLLRNRMASPIDVAVIRAELRRRHSLLLKRKSESERRYVRTQK